ncbi:MAG: hypothetical protein RLZ97_1838, partial [Verrucomicrobiota bacterium]
MRMFSSIPVLLAALLVISPVAAQQGKPAREVRLRLLAFEPRLQMPEVFLHDPAAENGVAVKAGIRTYLNHQFVMMPLVGDKLVVTDKEARESLAAGEPRVGEAFLPPEVRSAILLLLPGEEGAAEKGRFLVVPDLEKDFPAGSFHVSNFSPSQVRILLEKKTYSFKPGGQRIIEDPPAKENHQIGMRTFTLEGETWRQIANGLWTHPGKR